MSDGEVIRALTAERDLLLEQVNQLRQALAPEGVRPPDSWGLTAFQSRLFAHMTARRVVTSETARIALYLPHERTPGPEVFKRHVSNIRGKVEPFGVVIRNIYGEGYVLDRDTLPPGVLPAAKKGSPK